MKLFLIGFMGSGKSHWGKIWAERFGLTFYDLDEEIEKKAGKIISEVFHAEGEEYFRELETDTLHSFKDKNDCLIACGGGTPCFNNNMDWMNEQGTTIYLNPSAVIIFNRLKEEKEKRPLIKALSDAQLHSFIAAKTKEREAYYNKADLILDENSIAAFNKPVDTKKVKSREQ